MPHPPVALTIAGSDSSGGAGLQADLKTFEAWSVFGASAVTLVTAQNTVGVQAIEVLDPSLVVAQAVSVYDDLPVAATKLGALGRRDVIEAVADLLRTRRASPLVIDPVMISKHGHALLPPDAVAALSELLLPLADVVTPNRHEAAALTGLDVDSPASARLAAEALRSRGPRAVAITGIVDEQGGVLDVLATSAGVRVLPATPVAGTSVHGSGCTHSAAVTAALARGMDVEHALDAARVYAVEAIRRAPGLGHGVGPLGHGAARALVP